MRPLEESDTIAAIATPPGSGGIGIIRISGPAAVDTAARIFQSSGKTNLLEVPTHTVHHGVIRHPVTAEVLDEVLVSVLRKPKSYTREDTVEIQAHGGPFVLGKILELALSGGCRLAAPGEFTKRAFLNGRIDLTEAEAVMEVIDARTESAHRAAVSRLQGNLGRRIGLLRDELIRLLSTIEAFIDFPEEELGDLTRKALLHDMQINFDGVNSLFASADAGRIVQEGLAAVIIGRPNSGKSSLLNRLLDDDRAIVSTAPGTTRDLIEESVQTDGLRLRIIDTAGIRPSDDPVEIEGMRRTRRAIDTADLLVCMVDATGDWTPEEEASLRTHTEGRKAILVINKVDLAQDSARHFMAHPPIPVPAVAVSALHGTGIDELKVLLRKTASESIVGGGEPVLVAQMRHKVMLKECCEHLGLALRSLEDQMPEELIALDLRAALDRLGEIIGAVTTEDILDNIFNKFCIGK